MTDLMLIAAGVLGAVIGLGWCAWAWFADRSRGRRRCMRCAYDMSTVSGLKCPECGHTSRSEAALYGTFRHRRSAKRGAWLVVIGLLFVFGAWVWHTPTSFMPTSLLVRMAPNADKYGQKLGDRITGELSGNRSLTREQYISLVRETTRMLREDPDRPVVRSMRNIICNQTVARGGDHTESLMQTMESADGDILESATRRVTELRSAMTWLEAADAEALGTAAMKAAINDPQRHALTASIILMELGKGGKQSSDWMAERYFQPTSDWGLLHAGVLTAMRSNGELVEAVVARYDGADIPARRRAARLLVVVINPQAWRVELPPSAAGKQRFAELKSRREELAFESATLVREEIAKLDDSDSDQLVTTCLTLAGEVWGEGIIPALPRLKSLAADHTEARVNAAAQKVLDEYRRAAKYKD